MRPTPESLRFVSPKSICPHRRPGRLVLSAALPGSDLQGRPARVHTNDRTTVLLGRNSKLEFPKHVSGNSASACSHRLSTAEMVLSFEDGAALALRVPVPCSVLWLPGQSGTNSGLKTMETCPLSVPAARSPKWAPRQGRAPAGGSGRQPPCLCQLRVAASPRPRLRGHMTVFPLRGASLLLSLGGHQSHEDSLGSVPPDLNSVTSAGVSNFSSGPRAQAHTRAHAPTHARTCAPTRACTPTAPPLLSAHTVRRACCSPPESPRGRTDRQHLRKRRCDLHCVRFLLGQSDQSTRDPSPRSLL